MAGRDVGLASRSNAGVLQDRARQGRDPSWLQPPTCVLQVAPEDGVIHPVNTSTSRSLHFFRLPSTRLALFLFSIAGNSLSLCGYMYISILLRCHTCLMGGLVCTAGYHARGKEGFVSQLLEILTSTLYLYGILEELGMSRACR